jgi:curved DNA-binding protein
VKYKDYYATLGVARDADPDQIKKAYRKLARQTHPDVSKAADAEAKFKDAAEAYATLKDPAKRAAYDALGRQAAGAEFSPPPQWRSDHAAGFDSFDNIDLADLLAEMGRRGGGARSGGIPVPGQDYEDTVRISLADAHRGTTLSLKLSDPGGEHTLEVSIPAGVTAGQKLRLRGKGGKGRNGGPDGDFYLHIELRPDPVFRVDRHDLYFDLPLTPWEAALGAELEVPTLDGSVMLTVPPGSRSGRKLRLRGRGLASRRGPGGDLYATVRIDVPATLSEPERHLYQELARISTFNPRTAFHKETTHEPAAPGV